MPGNAARGIAHSLRHEGAAEAALWMRASQSSDIIFPGAAQNSEWSRNNQPFLEHYAQLASASCSRPSSIASNSKKCPGTNPPGANSSVPRPRNYPGPLLRRRQLRCEFESIKFWTARLHWHRRYDPLPDDLASTAGVVEKIAPCIPGAFKAGSLHRSRVFPTR